MMSSIESERDEWGDKLYFVHDEDCDHFWFDNPYDCHLDKNTMTEFLKRCLDYLEVEE